MDSPSLLSRESTTLSNSWPQKGHFMGANPTETAPPWTGKPHCIRANPRSGRCESAGAAPVNVPRRYFGNVAPYVACIYIGTLYRSHSMVGPEIKRGSAELAILALLKQEPLHGYEIATRIEEQTAGVLKFDMASLYPMLYRLEKQGWIKGQWEELANGRKRRCYRLTPAGRAKLAPLRQEWKLFFEALDRLAGVSHA